MKTRTRIAASVATILILCALCLASMTLIVCRDFAFICENTASRHGYREWIFGSRTGEWYQQSAIESFIQQEHPRSFSIAGHRTPGPGETFTEQVSFTVTGGPAQFFHCAQTS
jgi:hypothetical protein